MCRCLRLDGPGWWQPYHPYAILSFTLSSIAVKHAIHIPKYFIVPKSQYTKTLRLQPGSPALIFFNLLVMLASIHFDDQALFKANKINDVSSQYLLPSKFRGGHLAAVKPAP